MPYQSAQHQKLKTAHQRAFLDIFDNPKKRLHQQQVFELMPSCDMTIPAPKILVYLDCFFDDFNKNYLAISYFIEKTSIYHLDITDYKQKRADFLWQENCLECFIEYDKANAYFESNVALDGRYNVYFFDDYRTPSTLPPKQANTDDISCHILADYDIADDFYSRHVYLIHHKAALPTHLNPTVILYQNATPIFYATKHANPPDFHHKIYWQSI